MEKLETRPKDMNPKEEGFDSLKKKIKQKVKREKGFESPTQRLYPSFGKVMNEPRTHGRSKSS